MSKLALTVDRNTDTFGWRHTGSLATYQPDPELKGILTIEKLNEAFVAAYRREGLEFLCLPCFADEFIFGLGCQISDSIKQEFLRLLSEDKVPDLDGLRTYSLSNDLDRLVRSIDSSMTGETRKNFQVTPVKAMETGTGLRGVPHLRHRLGFGCSKTSGSVSPARQAAALQARLDNPDDTSLSVQVKQVQTEHNCYFIFDVLVNGTLTARHYLSAEVGKKHYSSELMQLMDAEYEMLTDAGVGVVLIISTAMAARGHALELRHWIDDNNLNIQVMHLGFVNSSEDKNTTGLQCEYYQLIWGDKEQRRIDRRSDADTFDKSEDSSCSTKQNIEAGVDDDDDSLFTRKSHQEQAFELLNEGAISRRAMQFGWLQTLPINKLRSIAEQQSNEGYVRSARELLKANTDGTLNRLVGMAAAALRDEVGNLPLTIRAASEAGHQSTLAYEEAEDMFFGLNLIALLPTEEYWSASAAYVYEELYETITRSIDGCRRKIARELGSSKASRRVGGLIAKQLLKGRKLAKRRRTAPAGLLSLADIALEAEANALLQSGRRISKRYQTQTSAGRLDEYELSYPNEVAEDY